MNNDLDYLILHQRKFENRADKNLKEANEIFRELVRELILAATVFLSISAFIFTSSNLVQSLDIYDKHFLALAWIFIVVSIFCGIIQYYIDKRHFEKWANAGYKVAESISTSEADTKEKFFKMSSKYHGNLPTSSSTVPIAFQVSFLILGLILLIIVMIKILFSL